MSTTTTKGALTLPSKSGQQVKSHPSRQAAQGMAGLDVLHSQAVGQQDITGLGLSAENADDDIMAGALDRTFDSDSDEYVASQTRGGDSEAGAGKSGSGSGSARSSNSQRQQQQQQQQGAVSASSLSKYLSSMVWAYWDGLPPVSRALALLVLAGGVAGALGFAHYTALCPHQLGWARAVVVEPTSSTVAGATAHVSSSVDMTKAFVSSFHRLFVYPFVLPSLGFSVLFAYGLLYLGSSVEKTRGSVYLMYSVAALSTLITIFFTAAFFLLHRITPSAVSAGASASPTTTTTMSVGSSSFSSTFARETGVEVSSLAGLVVPRSVHATDTCASSWLCASGPEPLVLALLVLEATVALKNRRQFVGVPWPMPSLAFPFFLWGFLSVMWVRVSLANACGIAAGFAYTYMPMLSLSVSTQLSIDSWITSTFAQSVIGKYLSLRAATAISAPVPTEPSALAAAAAKKGAGQGAASSTSTSLMTAALLGSKDSFNEDVLGEIPLDFGVFGPNHAAFPAGSVSFYESVKSPPLVPAPSATAKSNPATNAAAASAAAASSTSSASSSSSQSSAANGAGHRIMLLPSASRTFTPSSTAGAARTAASSISSSSGTRRGNKGLAPMGVDDDASNPSYRDSLGGGGGGGGGDGEDDQVEDADMKNLLTDSAYAARAAEAKGVTNASANTANTANTGGLSSSTGSAAGAAVEHVDADIARGATAAGVSAGEFAAGVLQLQAYGYQRVSAIRALSLARGDVDTAHKTLQEAGPKTMDKSVVSGP